MHRFLPEQARLDVSDKKNRQITYETHANFRAVEDVCDDDAGKQRTMCTCICAPAYVHLQHLTMNITSTQCSGLKT